MKIFQVLFVTLLLGISFSACSDDDNDTPTFDTNFLKQTKWSGTLTSFAEGKSDVKGDILVYFITDSRGNYDFPNTIFHNIEFNYIIDGKLLNVTGQDKSVMNGDWILTDMKNDKLSFRKGLANNTEYSILELTKTGDNGNSSKRN